MGQLAGPQPTQTPATQTAVGGVQISQGPPPAPQSPLPPPIWQLPDASQQPMGQEKKSQLFARESAPDELRSSAGAVGAAGTPATANANSAASARKAGSEFDRLFIDASPLGQSMPAFHWNVPAETVRPITTPLHRRRQGDDGGSASCAKPRASAGTAFASASDRSDACTGGKRRENRD
jgi:hypothetical protein